MRPYVQDIEQAVIDNEAFRKVMYTTSLLQVELLSLQPHEAVGMESHESDHFYVVVQGGGQAAVDGERYGLSSGWCLLSPAGTPCNIVNTGPVALKLLALCAPPHHQPGLIHRTRLDAEVDEGLYGS